MKTTDLIANKREDLGKKGTRTLRQEGKIPAVVYDNGKATHISLDYKASKHAVFTPDTYIIQLDIEGDKINTLIHDVQYHPVKDTIEHVELLQIAPDKEVELSLPVKLVGTPAGVIKGGKMMTKLRKIKVRGVPQKLPEYVEIDVTSLDLGFTIKVQDANIEGLEVLTSPSAAVASVEIPRSLRSAQAGKEAEVEEE
ncbi:MAG: 50S ribosomal protein L25 [Bacteroidota bacterium]